MDTYHLMKLIKSAPNTDIATVLITLILVVMIVGFILWFPGAPDFTPPN